MHVTWAHPMKSHVMVYLSSHGCHSDHRVLHMMYYVMYRCGNYVNKDKRFGREAHFCDIML
jgi:hypothetical protein